MAKKKKAEKAVMKKTAMVKIADTVLFIAFNDEQVNGTVTKEDGSTQTFTCELKEVK